MVSTRKRERAKQEQQQQQQAASARKNKKKKDEVPMVEDGWRWPEEEEGLLVVDTKTRTRNRCFNSIDKVDDSGEVEYTVKVGDLVVTLSNEEAGADLRLNYWVAVASALYQDTYGAKFVTLRFLDSFEEWAYTNFDTDSRMVKEAFEASRHLPGIFVETDVCEDDEVDVIQGKIDIWAETEEEYLSLIEAGRRPHKASVDLEHLCKNGKVKFVDAPRRRRNVHWKPDTLTEDTVPQASSRTCSCAGDGLICDEEGKRVEHSDTLWPAPPESRVQRGIRFAPLMKCSLCSVDPKLRGELLEGKSSGYAIVDEDSPSADEDARLKAAVDEVSEAFDEAAKKLQLSECLTCREEERGQIYNFLWTAVSTGGAGNVLYISGMPGTGKTASVMGVVGELKGMMAERKVPPFKFIYINAFRLATPNDLFKELYNALEVGPPRVSAAVAHEKLEAYLRKSSANLVLIVVIDELDYLVTKQQKVLYCLFDWPTLPTSKLAVVAIANTMDLPERMMPRVASRLGFGRLNFGPYSAQQIAEIIEQRMKECGGESVFESNAIKLCAMRVASVSGDVRKALHICRRAIELRKDGCKVTPAEIAAAQSDTFISPLTDKVSSLHTFQFRFMLAFMLLLRAQKTPQSITLHALYEKVKSLSYHHPPKGYNDYPEGYVMPFRDFELMARKLENWGIIHLFTVPKNSLYLREQGDEFKAGLDGMDEIDEDLQAVTQKGKTKDLLSTADKQRSRMAAGSVTDKRRRDERLRQCAEDEPGALTIVCLSGYIDRADVEYALKQRSDNSKEESPPSRSVISPYLRRSDDWLILANIFAVVFFGIAQYLFKTERARKGDPNSPAVLRERKEEIKADMPEGGMVTAVPSYYHDLGSASLPWRPYVSKREQHHPHGTVFNYFDNPVDEILNCQYCDNFTV
ncbi:Origin recognition complex, subunit 1 [Perkinsus chesapeaki]|uniref:Origin recognition complex subunit 1 n=1 Tax=Perkinsus chesapeaki TaxID=330153 RepID=A0A7J6LXU3_PERCH|nr:Origin recognition complex, subunit 1 [Perkinsus chesapeaki]